MAGRAARGAKRTFGLSCKAAKGPEADYPVGGLRDRSPGLGGLYFVYAWGRGFYTWLIPDVQQFLTYHRAQPGKRSRKAVLALGLLLFAGMRRQDMVALGKQNCRGATPGVLGDVIRYIPKKTIKIRRDDSQKPLLPVLRQILLDSADITGDLTFLVTEHGKPFNPNGFGNWFRDRCDEASLPMCTAHGLKKAGATIAAENGATTRQLVAMFDWDSPSMAEVTPAPPSRSGWPGKRCS